MRILNPEEDEASPGCFVVSGYMAMTIWPTPDGSPASGTGANATLDVTGVRITVTQPMHGQTLKGLAGTGVEVVQGDSPCMELFLPADSPIQNLDLRPTLPLILRAR